MDPSFSPRPSLAHGSPGPARQVRTYLTWAAFLWLSLTVVNAFGFLDRRISDHAKISLWSTWAQGRDSLFVVGMLAFTGVIFGALLTLPACFAAVQIHTKLESMTRRRGQARPLGAVFLRALPVGLFVICHFMALSLSLSAAPQVARSWTRAPSVLSEWSRFLYGLFFLPENKEILAGWRNAADKSAERTFVFLLPASALSKGQFPRVQKLMGEPRDFFLSKATATSVVADFVAGRTLFDGRLLLPPVVAPKIAMAFDDEGVTRPPQGAVLKLSPALAPVTRVVGGVAMEREVLTERRIVRRRIAQSQWHLYWLFRLNVLSSWEPDWTWSEMSSDDALVLRRFAADAARVKAENGWSLVQLSETETPMVDRFEPLRPLQWRAPQNASDRTYLMEKLDESLALAIGPLVQAGNLTVLVLPYLESETASPLTRAFVKFPEEREDLRASAAPLLTLRALLPQIAGNTGKELMTDPMYTETRELDRTGGERGQVLLRESLTCEGARFRPESLEGNEESTPRLGKASLSRQIGLTATRQLGLPSFFDYLPTLAFREGLVCSLGHVDGNAPRKAFLVTLGPAGQSAIRGVDGDDTEGEPLSRTLFHVVSGEDWNLAPEGGRTNATSRAARARRLAVDPARAKKERSFLPAAYEILSLESDALGRRTVVPLPDEEKKKFLARWQGNVESWFEDLGRRVSR